MPEYLHIQIPTACHENWDKMNAAVQGKFCNSCQKNVTDFTLMNNNELVNFFKKNPENICGRFNDNQLNTNLLIPRKKIPWLKYFFQVAIPAMLFSTKATAQGSVRVIEKHVIDKKKVKSLFPIQKTEITCDTKVIPGKPVLPSPEDNEPLTRTVIRVGGAISYRVIKQTKYLFPVRNSNSFTIYPNPIASGSWLNINWKNKISSDQSIEIYNLTGSLLQQETIRIDKKSNQQNIRLNPLPAGTYVLKVTDSKTRKSSSQQFIVE